ncbi:hypothetical protein MKW92_033904 [Papaver armeniacum]|nr:hypothetical protein MKW92_033904 [Papaver armeniacum]
MEIDEFNNEIGKEALMDQQDSIDNLVVNEGNEEEIPDNNDSPKHSEDTSLESDGYGVSFSPAIQPPFCNLMERLSVSSANTSIPAPNLHAASEEMIGDDINFGPDITNIFFEDEFELFQRTPIHESNTLGTNADNEGKVFENITKSEDYLQSLPCADLGEGSKSMVETGNKDRISELPDALIHHIFLSLT